MNPRRTWTVLFLAGATALLIAAPGASAKPGYVVTSPDYRSITLGVKSSNGYRVYAERRGRSVFLLAANGQSTAAYVTRSRRPRGDMIATRFPGLGRLAVRFRPKGPPQHIPPFFPQCHGGGAVKQPGYFVGTIRFRGERGYTYVRTTRARGAIETVAREVCKRSMFDEGDEPDTERIELLALSRSGRRAVSFDASAIFIPESAPLTDFGATVAERRRGMEIYRSVFVPGKAQDLNLGDTRPFPLSATVTPPAPFQGSAEFQRDAEGNSTWTGSLSVPFPGLGRVALAGPSFTARLCQPPGCTGSGVDGHRSAFRADRVDDHRDAEQLVLPQRAHPQPLRHR